MEQGWSQILPQHFGTENTLNHLTKQVEYFLIQGWLLRIDYELVHN